MSTNLMVGTDRDNQLREVPVDFVTGALQSITVEHANIHDGTSYNTFTKFNLGAGATRKITLLTDAVRFIHYRPFKISTSADKVTANLYEGSSGNTGGTPLAIQNRNRISTKLSVLTIVDGVTVTTNGTIIDQEYVGGGTGVGNTSAGSGASSEEEIVLKKSTLYTVEIINGSASAQDIQVKLRWYEEGMGV